MHLLVVLLGSVCALVVGAPSVQKIDSPHPAYIKDVEILPSDDTRIIRGQAAVRDQFPYQISLRWGFLSTASHICGASIISSVVVLTAAHCIQDYGTHTVVAGLLNRVETTSATQSRSASNIVVHENWPGGSVVSPWDVALIIVSSPFVFTTSVQPIELPSQGAPTSGDVVVSGWGRTSGIISGAPSVLQYVDLEVLPNEECAEDLVSVLGRSNPLDETMICTSGRQYAGVCSGDSGGPLVKDGVQVGIVSWGVSPCGITIAPSVFTRVSSYSNWIYNNL
ncbi:chymotrypsin-2-like [Agrilus planipennis]|uniref:Chymotrypsin-2-like n=1 Tax=Agrilus planipennis TaxID=224129 RepID=A0A7F5RKL3_AGRPL|nr:chymotrypsin-2-like [Agrilus planipennis]